MKTLKYFVHVLILLSLFFFVMISCKSHKNNVAKLPGTDTLNHAESVNPYIANDQSPMDMSYYPHDYPVLKMNGTDSAELVARVIYSRPQKKRRVIFGYSAGSLREYGKEWRLGANEATEIEFFKNVYISGKEIKKGRYIIYCIPYADKWTIILNTNLFTWGLHLDKTKDVFKTDVPTTTQSPPLEDFTMVFEPASYGTDLLMAWDNVKVILPIKAAK